MKKTFTGGHKFIKAMKIGLMQSIFVMIAAGLATAHDNYGQVLERKVSVTVDHVSLEATLSEIEKSSGVKFFYSIDQLEYADAISLHETDRPLGEILELILSSHHIQFKVYENLSTIILKKAKAQKTQTDAKISRVTKGLESERHKVTGTVKDAKTNQGMAGVNILVKGTVNGTSSDTDGNYSLMVEDNDVLVFSFIGYSETEVAVNTKSIIDVTLSEDISSLNEVEVNAGYWQIKEKEETGNISKISSADIQKQPVSNPLEALIGRMPGVYISQQSGVSGGGFSVQIRGQNSVSGANNPLYIVDGVPFSSTSLSSPTAGGSIIDSANPLNVINPADIESIEVLKDGDATAIYGSRGSNGVVLITTKKGKAGRTKFDVNVYQGVGKISRSMHLLNTQQWLTMRHEAFKNDKLSPGVTDYDLTTWDTTRNTDWQKKLIGGFAHTTSAQISMSGGTSNTQFLVGGGYYRQGAVFPGNFADQKGSAHFNLMHASENNKFKAAVTTSFVVDNNNLPRTDLTNEAITLAPDAPRLYTPAGDLNWENSTWDNPLATFLRSHYDSKTKNLVANGILSYELFPGFRIKSSLGYTNMDLDETSTVPIGSVNPSFPNRTGLAIFATNAITTWIAEPQLDYHKSIGEGVLTALVGSTFQESVQNGQSEVGFGYTNDALLTNLSAASRIFFISANYAKYKYNALFSRINYNFKGKYLINLTGRRDGSSRFGPDRRFSNFGAIGAAWIFSSEDFFNKSVISFGKLRTSYGITGSDQIGDYQYLSLYSTTSYPYNGISGLIPTRLTNPNYAWESNKKFEAGLELGFWNDKIQFMSSFYQNRSGNQLVGYSLPAIAGQTSIQANLPALVQNTGVELLIGYHPTKTGGIVWSTSVNVTVPRNALLRYPNLAASSYADTYVVGQPLSISKKYHSTGVDPQTGLYQFTDVDKDGSLSYPNDSQTIKKIGQNFYGGWTNGFQYKGFKLDVFLQFVKQQGPNYMGSFAPPGANYTNQPTIVMSRWQKPGDVSSIQRFTQGNDDALAADTNARAYSDRGVSDASFIRLKNVAFSWQVTPAWVAKANIQSLRLYIQGQNLMTFTNYLGFDPESKITGVLPPLRMLTAGFNLTL